MKELKELIKSLAIEQRDLKSQRKTGRVGKIPRTSWGYVDYTAVPAKIKDAWHAASQVQENKPRITAALNLYHELRGSDYRHGVRDEDLYVYGRAMRELREQFATEAAQ